MSSSTIAARDSHQRVYRMVIAGLLCAIGIVIPMFMPRVAIGPMSFTLASHVAIFIGMFISPSVSIVVCIGTTLGFFVTATPIIALRAASHIVFGIVGAYLLQKHPQLIEKPVSSLLFNMGLAVIHAVCEVLVVLPFFFMGTLFTAEQLTNGLTMSVFVLVGLGTLIHSMIDYTIAVIIWKPLRRVVRKA